VIKISNEGLKSFKKPISHPISSCQITGQENSFRNLPQDKILITSPEASTSSTNNNSRKHSEKTNSECFTNYSSFESLENHTSQFKIPEYLPHLATQYTAQPTIFPDCREQNFSKFHHIIEHSDNKNK
jgi:hypothetical protein